MKREIYVRIQAEYKEQHPKTHSNKYCTCHHTAEGQMNRIHGDKEGVSLLHEFHDKDALTMRKWTERRKEEEIIRNTKHGTIYMQTAQSK